MPKSMNKRERVRLDVVDAAISRDVKSAARVVELEARVKELQAVNLAHAETIARLSRTNITAVELSRLQDRVVELRKYEERYAAILRKCRETRGPCFCGVHISEAQAAGALVDKPPVAHAAPSTNGVNGAGEKGE